ncbi:MAG: Outer rane transport energization protein TonB, partial [Hydrocarboniphaga sp.]|nr:Outer rane transport energization protein TonB [Hydrocarboniphaga sp.]MDB5969377.1 Outer rane transport energization protein TonB [Hydrocarboniphaga sp.]
MEFGQRQDPKRRIIGITGVVIFHILLVYGLVNGLARKAIELL